MLEGLGKGIKSAFNRILTSVSVDKKIIEEVIVEIRRCLIQADVNLQLANSLADNMRKRAFEEKTPAGMTKREHVLKIVYEELLKFLGEKFEPLEIKKRPFIILLVGLLGGGKTTSCAKIARYLQKQGYGVGMICGDVYRPASLEQLRQLGEKINVPVYGEKGKPPIQTIKEGIKEFYKKDVIIVDTAGRHKQAKKLMEEIKEIAEEIKPDETILVVDASLGQAARIQAEAFSKAVPIGSIMVTKFDGTAKGGGALSACIATGAKVRFLGTGEHLEDFEVYDPRRFVSRLLGLGDLQTLLEKAKEAEIKPEKIEKIIEGKFTLQDFYDQIEGIRKMGSLSKIISLIPGSINLPDDLIKKQEEKMKSYKYIIQSMTNEEREDPNIITESRIKRISRGSGRAESEVRELLQQYNQMKKIMKSFGGKVGIERGALKDIAKRFGFKI
ncbi:MAG: signal recognition particle receptor subunit alpha [Candidatus Aenigmatarchaeota archaeon]